VSISHDPKSDLLGRRARPGAPSSSLGGFPPALAEGNPSAGTEAAPSAKDPRRSAHARQPRVTASPVDYLPRFELPPPAGGPVPAILIALAGALLVGLLFADELGLGPRHAQWRSRWLRRLPW
jgi:hypothetical protein